MTQSGGPQGPLSGMAVLSAAAGLALSAAALIPGPPARVAVVPRVESRSTPSLRVTGATTGDYHDEVTVAAVLSDGAGPLPGRSLGFRVVARGEGRPQCSAITDATGTASCTLIPIAPVGARQ